MICPLSLDDSPAYVCHAASVVVVARAACPLRVQFCERRASIRLSPPAEAVRCQDQLRCLQAGSLVASALSSGSASQRALSAPSALCAPGQRYGGLAGRCAIEVVASLGLADVISGEKLSVTKRACPQDVPVNGTRCKGLRSVWHNERHVKCSFGAVCRC